MRPNELLGQIRGLGGGYMVGTAPPSKQRTTSQQEGGGYMPGVDALDVDTLNERVREWTEEALAKLREMGYP